MTCPFIEETTEFGETKCRYDKEHEEIFNKKVSCIGGCYGNYTKCDIYKRYSWNVS